VPREESRQRVAAPRQSSLLCRGNHLNQRQNPVVRTLKLSKYGFDIRSTLPNPRISIPTLTHSQTHGNPPIQTEWEMFWLLTSLVLISGLSYKTTFSKELWTSSFPLYSIKPNLRNLFMKKLTRDRVVPIISASVS
jgi:hypothetical protein